MHGFVFCRLKFGWSDLCREDLVSRNGMLLSVSQDSMVNFMCGSTEFMWLKKMSAWFFSTDDIIHIPLPPWARYRAFWN